MKTFSFTKRFLVVLAVASAFVAQAQQWSGVSTATGNIYRSGNVGLGVGNTAPTSLLHIKNNNSGDALKIESCYSPGPGAGLCNPAINFGGRYRMIAWEGTGNMPSLTIGLVTSTGTTPAIYVDHVGSVGINTRSTAHALNVGGTILAKEIIVETGWSDFVFEKDYKLNSLDSVEAYIAEHKHLPEIPSAKDVETHGVKVGEVESKLLMKIEELTLYMIDANKKMKAMETQMKAMNEEISILKSGN